MISVEAIKSLPADRLNLIEQMMRRGERRRRPRKVNYKARVRFVRSSLDLTIGSTVDESQPLRRRRW
jgi:hypothetical protein